MRYFQSFHHSRTRNQANGVQIEHVLAESVDQVAQSLPSKHLDENVRHEIGDGGVCIGGLDVRKRMRKLLSRRPWHTAKRLVHVK